MKEPLPYDDPFDALEAVTERTTARWLDRFAQFFRVSPSGWAIKLLFPLAMLALGAVVVTAAFWSARYRVWGFIAIYFAPFGIETGIPAGVLAFELPAWLLVTIVLYVDLFGGLFLVWNLDHLLKVPWLGRWLQKLETKSAEKWAKHRRLRDLGVVGLTVFVMLPISGSGAIPGAIIGRFTGFPWGMVWLAIFIGSAVRVLAYTSLVVLFEDLFLAGR